MIHLFNHDTVRAMSRRKTLVDAQDRGDGGDVGGGIEGGSASSPTLRRSLTAVDLVLYGVGSSVGAGIFVLVGLGAKIAGPAIAVSFLSCGMACILTSLAYSEFASLIPASGSAFTYTYVAFGEFLAFCVGWNLILGYGFTASVTARAWADYTGDFVAKITGQEWIIYVTEFPLFGHSVDYTCSPLSLVIVGFSTVILLRGAKDSSTFNNLMTLTNLSILFLVIVAAWASGSVSGDNFTPFAPKGLPGILRGAGLVFFAFIGFDMVASMSEEVIHPEKNMPIGIVGSLVCSTLIYVAVSLSVVGMAPFQFLGETIPIVNALMANACCSHSEQLMVKDVQQCLRDCSGFEKPVLAIVGHVVSGGAIFGLMAACFTSLMGQPRIFYRMAKDGLWFPIFAKVNPETQVMAEGIKFTGIVASLLACFFPLEALANLISLGTLMVFTFVDAGVILLRLDNVARVAYDALQHPMDKLEAEKVFHRNHQQVVVLLLGFTGTLFASSIILSVSTLKWPLVVLGSVAAICAILIIYTPSTWTKNHHTVSHASHASFECPYLPIVPLGGVAFNTFMMGSLPLSSWVLCMVWLACGVSIYFAYGIHHSTLAREEASQNDDTVPLLEHSASSTDPANKRVYGSLRDTDMQIGQ